MSSITTSCGTEDAIMTNLSKMSLCLTSVPIDRWRLVLRSYEMIESIEEYVSYRMVLYMYIVYLF